MNYEEKEHQMKMITRSVFEKAAKECSERIKAGEYCIEDEIIDYAFTHIQNFESIINKFSTLSGNLDKEAMVIEIGRIEGFLVSD